MRKRNFLISATLLGAASFMLTGFDSAATVEDVMEKYMEASQSLTEFSADATLNAQIGIDMSSDASGTSTLSVGGTGDFTMDYKLDPLTFGMSGNLDIGAMGVEQNMNMQIYMVPADGGAYELYTYIDDGSGAGGAWEYESSTVDEAEMEEVISSILEAQKSMDLSTLPGTWSLGKEAVDVNGTSCYQLLYTVTYDDLSDLIADAMSASGETMSEEDAAMLALVMNGLVFNVEVDVDAATYLPMRMHMDMDGSDLSGINSLLSIVMASSSTDESVSMPDIELNISDLYLEAVYDYSTPVEVTVPDEALQAKDSTDGSQSDDLEDAMEDSLESIEDALESEAE